MRLGSVATVALLALLLGMAAGDIAIIDINDHWLKTQGLASYLDDAGVPYHDVTQDARAGRLNLEGADALIIGTFATSEPALHKGIDAGAQAIRALLARGGVVVEFTQADQEQDTVDWLPEPLRALRCDTDHDSCRLLEPDHALLTTPNRIKAVDLSLCALPGKPLAWETFAQHTGFGVIAAENNEGEGGFILEAEAGPGHVLLFAITPDKTYSSTAEQRKQAARAMLDNVIAYIAAAQAGSLAPVTVLDIGPPGTIRVTGIVYEDRNHDGTRDPAEPTIRDIKVSNGIDIVVTDASGTFAMEMPLAATRCVFPIIPADYEIPGNVYARIPEGAQNDRQIELGLSKRSSPLPQRFSIVQITDIHVGLLGQLSALSEDVAEVNEWTRAPDLVMATGDLVNAGASTAQYDDYRTAIADVDAPLVNVIGNHDYNSGPIATSHWERYLGPRYFSFDYGRYHCLCPDSTVLDDVQKAWIEKDLSMIPEGQPILVFQHHHPEREELDSLARYNTKAIFTGHWHGTREMLYKGILDINSATFRFGGIDRTARGFRVAEFDGDSIGFDYRVGGIERLLAVVSPAQSASVPPGRIPIVVNAYDTGTRVVHVTVTIRDPADHGRDAGGTIELTAGGDWSWFGTAEIDDKGRKLIEVTAVDQRGNEWRAWSDFVIDDTVTLEPEPEGDWPMFHGDPESSGIADVAIEPPLAPAWVTNTGGAVNIGSPVIAEGKVYIGTLFLHGIEDCTIACIDARSGELLWRTPTDSSIKNAPCAAGGMVYAVSAAGTLYAADADDGSIVWTASLGNEDVQRWDTCAPKAVDGVVYAGGRSHLRALDAKTGDPVWTAEPMGAQWWPSIYSATTIGDEDVYLGCQEGLFALNRATGNRIWEIKERAAAAATAGSTVYSRLGNDLAAVNAANGEIRWRAAGVFGDETGCPAVAPGKEEIVYAGGANGRMMAFRASDGTPLADFAVERGITSTQPYQRNERTVTSSPAVAGDLLIFGGNDGYLYVLDRHTMQERQKLYIGAPVIGSPAVSGNAVYVTAYDGNVYCFAAVEREE
jgi:outer membrane protein assembly factor BamB